MHMSMEKERETSMKVASSSVHIRRVIFITKPLDGVCSLILFCCAGLDLEESEHCEELREEMPGCAHRKKRGRLDISYRKGRRRDSRCTTKRRRREIKKKIDETEGSDEGKTPNTRKTK